MLTISPTDIRLVCTCESYPETYNAYYGRHLVGHVRLRAGWLAVRCPGFMSAAVYEVRDPLLGGYFPDEATRRTHLDQAKQAIAHWVVTEGFA
jgi:hypothetical protein